MTPKYRNFRSPFRNFSKFRNPVCVNQTMKNSEISSFEYFWKQKPPFSLFFTLHNFVLSLAFFRRFFNIHRVKSIQKSRNYRSHLDSIVFDRCRSARARVSIFDEFRNVFRGNFEKSEKFRNGEKEISIFHFFFWFTQWPESPPQL